MGTILGSDNKSNSKLSEECNCELFKKYQHCCRRDCFGPTAQQVEPALLSALQSQNVEYLLSTIIEYLPDCFSTKRIILDENEGYSYTYECLTQNVDKIKIPPCKLWLKQYEDHDHIPEFNVCFIIQCKLI